ncbi:hypothetical protein KVJ66_00165 [Helicobacter pylori]|nr:hypothetical protein KVJ66_00165 [Helicobacter pylori]
MLLNYDFLEMVDDEPQRNTSLTVSIDKALADKKLARQNKPSVRVLGKAMPLSNFLDAVGDEISRLKYDMSHKTIKGSTIESANLISIYKKIANGHPKEFFLDAMIERQENAIKRIEARKCAVSDDYRQGMRRNIQVSKIAKALRQGKEVSKTLITKVLANTIDTDAGYCFISDLATQLDSISPRLSKSIVTAIEQAEGIRLLYALIDKVTYNSLHNTLNFIFDIDNPMSDQALNELVVEVPREALKNVKLPQIKNELTSQIFDGAYQFRGNDYQFKG